MYKRCWFGSCGPSGGQTIQSMVVVFSDTRYTYARVDVMVASRGLGEQLIAGYLGSPACKAHNASQLSMQVLSLLKLYVPGGVIMFVFQSIVRQVCWVSCCSWHTWIVCDFSRTKSILWCGCVTSDRWCMHVGQGWNVSSSSPTALLIAKTLSKSEVLQDVLEHKRFGSLMVCLSNFFLNAACQAQWLGLQVGNFLEGWGLLTRIKESVEDVIKHFHSPACAFQECVSLRRILWLANKPISSQRIEITTRLQRDGHGLLSSEGCSPACYRSILPSQTRKQVAKRG